MKKLPDAVRSKAILAVGAPGSGKSSNTAEAIIIPDLEAGKQVVIIDPTDAWFGLALSKNGKSASGYPIAVFGGDHGSVPLTPNMGRAMGELLGREPISAVLSIWHFSLHEQIVFVSEFSAAIMEVNKKPIRVVYDEADEFIPQKPELGGDLLKCKLRAKRIVTRGRKSGFRPVLITQRPQALDTAVRNLCQVIMAFQSPGHHERTQIEDYIKSNGDPKQMQKMLSSLSGLQVGEAWVWAPREKYLSRIRFPMISCFDSFKEIDETTKKIKVVPISDKNLKTIHAALQDFEIQRKANDPSDLRREVGRLKKELMLASSSTAPAKDTAEIKKISFDAGVAAGHKQNERQIRVLKAIVEKEVSNMKHKLSQILSNMARNAKVAEDGIAALRESAAQLQAATDLKFPELGVELEKMGTVVTTSAPIPSKSIPMKQPASYRRPHDDEGRVNGVTKPQKKMIDALAWWRAAGNNSPTKEMVAVVAGYKPSSGGVNNLLAELSSMGMISRPTPGVISLTDTGVATAEFQEVTTVEELAGRVEAILTAPQSKMLAPILAAYPGDISKDDAAVAAGYLPTSGGVNNLLSELSTLSIITRPRPGVLMAAKWLFMEAE